MSVDKDPAAELLRIARENEIDTEDLRVICFSEFGKHKFSDLTEKQKWCMVEMIDPGPPFEQVVEPGTKTVGWHQRNERATDAEGTHKA